MKVVREVKRYGLLLAARDSEYVKKVYGGYFNVFVESFGEEGEIWDLFRVVDGEFPEMSALEDYDGFVVSGSPFDAFGNDIWILKLCFLLQTLDAMQKKVLGICFGHQVLCRALGGKVGRSSTGWDLGLRKVRIQNTNNIKYLKDIPRNSTLTLIECHQDEVWEVPLRAKVIAFSDKTGVEMFHIGDHILGIQGHPEYSQDILFSLVDRLLNNNSIDFDFAYNAKLHFQFTQPNTKSWRLICRNFLKQN